MDEAERRWLTIRKNALRAGVSYAAIFHNTQLSALRLEREGPKSMVEQRPFDRGTLATGTPVMRAMIASVAAQAGEIEFARQQLALLGDPSGYPQDAYYLHLLANLATCAFHVGDKPRCEQLFALLTPYADLNTPSPMGYYLGSVAHFLALVSAGVGRTVAAGSFFERALERNRAMGYRAGIVHTLLAHGRLALKLGNKSLARDRLTEAQTLSTEIGMRAASAESTELLGSC
jgi:hypothetical protein